MIFVSDWKKCMPLLSALSYMERRKGKSNLKDTEGQTPVSLVELVSSLEMTE